MDQAAASSLAATSSVSTAHLAYLVAISRHRTWAEAAASLGVSPSALSQGVADFERRHGVRLFASEGRRRVAYEHTATVVQYAEQILADITELTRWLEHVGAGRVGRLRVGMIDIAAVHYFRDAVRTFRHQHPGLEVGFSVAPTGELLARLDRSELDVVVCVDPEGTGRFDSVPLLRDELAVYAPVGELSNAAPPPAAWGPWMLFPTTSRTRTSIDRRLRAIGAPIVVEMESHQPEVLCEMVRLGLGWTVLPTAQAEAGPVPLRRAMAEPLLTRTISAVTRPGGARHPAVNEFIASLRDAAAGGSPASRGQEPRSR
ncbi:MAG TPA: hypothetical protein DCR14_13410 [Acidimicrobiaceae bacterium]|nr:hypothetical protein [Acidimicrobiaceae bacterium]